MPSKYHHRRLSQSEFNALRREANMSLNDFLYLTGRHGKVVSAFMRSDADDPDSNAHRWIPTMADALILELAARYPPTLELMRQIADEYSIGASARELAQAERIRKGEAPR